LQELDLRIAFEGKSSGLADTQLRAVIQLLKNGILEQRVYLST
jgi:hypothetical protein